MFWNKNKSSEVDVYVSRIHFVMLFAASLAGKNKVEVASALRDVLRMEVEENTEDRFWTDPTMKDIYLMISGDFTQSPKVDVIGILGTDSLDTLSVNCIVGIGEPKRVNFFISTKHPSRTTPKLARMIADRLEAHRDFDREELGHHVILSQKSRNR